MLKVLFIDNYDSFTYNLVDEFEKRGARVVVYRNDVGMSVLDAAVRDGAGLAVLSPGPGTPEKSGLCPAFLKRYAGKIPIFGVCLGMQAIVQFAGGRVDRAPAVVHGKSSVVEHDGKGIFEGLENPLRVGRYHSLVGYDIPEDTLEVSARTGDLVMAVRHRNLPICGVQFHPESVLTPTGGKMIDRLIRTSADYAI